jgi:flagellum-specific peptidoglycan hydrolase FlgJ
MKTLLLLLLFVPSHLYAPFGTPAPNAPEFDFEQFKELVFTECQHPVIVCSQAILESANFTSNVFKTYNNPFGIRMYDVKLAKWRYRDFDTWQQSVYYYRDFQLRKYKGGCYFTFLEQLPYAMDTNYIDKVKQICLSWD